MLKDPASLAWHVQVLRYVAAALTGSLITAGVLAWRPTPVQVVEVPVSVPAPSSSGMFLPAGVDGTQVD